MKPGLTTLADLPDLAAGKKPTSTIVVARLDDRLRDARYGAFKITQSDVDGWQRNLTATFGGRVAIDADHSSDRGGGTRAMGWITGIGQVGKLITADVEWTPRGAKSIRNGDYRHISPTFVADYCDEHGEKHGRALIGAALTNRPVLRAGMPCLSLSRDSFAGVATPRKRKKTMSQKTRSRKAAKKLLTRALLAADSEHAKRALAQTLHAVDPKQLADASPRPFAGSLLSADAVTTLAQYSPAMLAANVPPGVPAGTIDWQPPQGGASRIPPNIDDTAGRALHTRIANHAASTGQHYFEAMADVTGIPDYRTLSDIPPPLGAQQGLNPEQAAKYANGRALAGSAGIGWMDAMQHLDHATELSRMQSDTGEASVPWLDSRPLAIPPRPYSDEDWGRDQSRAAAAGIEIDKAAWQAAAALGKDAVGQAAEEKRRQAPEYLQAQTAGFLDQARAREDAKRAGAINDELIRRARNRVAPRRLP